MIDISIEKFIKALDEHFAAHRALIVCQHEPVQKGMQKSWCKHCDINMRMKDGTYQIEEAA